MCENMEETIAMVKDVVKDLVLNKTKIMLDLF